MKAINNLLKILANVKVSLFFLFTLSLVCCSSNNELIKCYKEKGLFTNINTYQLSIDSIKSAKDFGNFATEVSDTMQQCQLLCGFIYNYADSSLKPNIDTSKNILIPCLYVFSKNCTVDKSLVPELNILMLPNDSLVIISKEDTAVYSISHDYENIYKNVNKYYTEKFKDVTNYSNLPKSFTYVYINDSLDFHSSLLNAFRIIFRAYYNSVTKSINTNYGMDFCQLNDDSFKKMTSIMHLNILVGDFDIRNNDYKKELEKEKQKEEIEIPSQDQ